MSNYYRFSSIFVIKSSLDLPDLSTRRLSSHMSLLQKKYYTSSLHQSLRLPPSYISRRTDHACKIGPPRCSFTAQSSHFYPNHLYLEWPSLRRCNHHLPCEVRRRHLQILIPSPFHSVMPRDFQSI